MGLYQCDEAKSMVERFPEPHRQGSTRRHFLIKDFKNERPSNGAFESMTAFPSSCTQAIELVEVKPSHLFDHCVY